MGPRQAEGKVYRARHWVRSILVAAFGVVAALLACLPALAQGREVTVLTLDGVINPVTATYVARGIRTAAAEGAQALIIQLDTPGGLMESTEAIVRAIANAPLPVVVYVAPRGARAASAGVFITYAAHVAAMAPDTRIGAATPVAFGEEGQPVSLPPEMQRKIEEDALAALRSLAQERGRNPEWAERAVREAASATAREALDQGIVEILAEDLNDLLRQLNERRVVLASGREITLATRGASLRFLPMSALERFLLTITNPTVAYLLLSVGLLGLWVEFSQPGVSLPGVLGGVCVLLGLYALGTLPVNWAAVFLMLFAFVLFAFDIFASTHGVLTIGGMVAFIMGSLLLFHSPEPYLRVQPWAIALVAGVVLVLVVLIVRAAIRGQRRPIVSGPEALIGAVGEVREELDPEGLVFVDGALWRARSSGERIAAGRRVEVVRIEGLLLHVRPHEEGPSQG
jgi:membrane-bound serine protease (ClpP class)